ncbi:MAG: type II toxin-antitoxin system HicB family antitoxin, partial [Chloroflexi bacterium]|nr:type II toxin-antitoxin system HicB family antitoxin [Chloroflexota bacterium]
EFSAELGREPERSSSGKFNVRVPPDLHRLIVFRAELDNISMNRWIVRTLASSVAKPGDTNELAGRFESPRRDAEEEKEYA